MMKKITLFIFLLTVSLGYSQDPATGPTDPPARDAGDVVSFYNGITTPSGDDYTNIANVGFVEFGAGTIVGDVVLGDGNTVIKYTNYSYSGIGGQRYDVSEMEMLHIDFYSPNVTNFRIKLELHDGGGFNELDVPGGPPTPGQWNSYDIDLSTYGIDFSKDLLWIIPVTNSNGPTTMYLDNIYFYRTPVDPTTDARLSVLEVDNVPLEGFAPSIIDYDYKVPTGTVVVPQITTATTTQGGASRVITQASGIPGAATVVVTASDGLTTKTYTVNIVEVGPGTDALTPPARAVADVASVYSNAYTNNVSDGGPVTFASASVVEQSIVDVNNKLLVLTVPNPGGGFQYGYFTPSATSFDLTDFTNFHVDFYVDGPVSDGQQFQILLQNFDGSNNFMHNLIYNFNVNALGSGSWISGDVLLSAFTNSGLSRSGIKQIQVVAAGAPAFGPIYIDNIYFHKNTVLSTTDFDKTSFSAYPNPTQDSWTVKTKNVNISSVQVYDILGKNVLSLSPNASEVKIDATKLSKGLYFATVRTEAGSESLKLIKN